jgi:hypothetical protein
VVHGSPSALPLTRSWFVFFKPICHNVLLWAVVKWLGCLVSSENPAKLYRTGDDNALVRCCPCRRHRCGVLHLPT